MPFDQENYEAPAITPAHYRVEPQCVDSVLKVLQDARRWLSDPAHWCQNALILDEKGFDGGRCKAPSASCAWGALLVVDERQNRHSAAYLLLESLCGHGRLQWFNDELTTPHADVLALFDHAISARRSELAL